MAKTKEVTVEDVIASVDGMAVEDLVKVKEAVTDKIASMKHLVISDMREQMQKQMQLFGLTASDLGFGSPVKGSKKAVGERKRAAPQGECPICQFATDEPHDGRKHRSQGENKRPFTDEELSELGLRKVA